MSDKYTDDLGAIADALHEIARRLDEHLDVPASPIAVEINFWPSSGDEAAKVATIDMIGEILLGKVGAPRLMHNGSVHHDVDGMVGPIEVEAYAAVELTPERKAALRK